MIKNLLEGTKARDSILAESRFRAGDQVVYTDVTMEKLGQPLDAKSPGVIDGIEGRTAFVRWDLDDSVTDEDIVDLEHYNQEK